MNLFWWMKYKGKYVEDYPLKKNKQSLMIKSFAPDSFSLLGMGEQDLGSHLVNMRNVGMRMKSPYSEGGRA